MGLIIKKRGSTYFYRDELADDFEELGLKRKKLPDNYKYKRKNKIYIIASNFLYYLIAQPILSVVCYIKGIRVENKKVLKKFKRQGAFIYQNHTNIMDVLQLQAYVDKWQRVNILGYSDSLSIPIVKRLVKALGLMPIPNSKNNYKNFLDAMDFYLNKGEHILIFPEAHIWPYYTKIRPFKDSSFHYPAYFNKPVIPVCTVYRRGLFKFSRPKETLVVGEPIYPNNDLSIKDNKAYLRNECYNQLVKISNSYNQYEYFKYEKIVE